jgi:predicted PurR-regulated permease PerM
MPTARSKNKGSGPVNKDFDAQRIARTVLMIAVVTAGVWTLWRFLPALAWAGVLAVATWPLRQRLIALGMKQTAAASLLTLVTALVLILPLIGIAFEIAHERTALLEWVRGVMQNGLGSPDWLSQVPLIGDRLTAWWNANVAPPGAARTMFGHVGSIGVFSLTRTVGIELATRVTILVFTLLTLFFLFRDGPTLMKEAKAISDRLFGPPTKDLGDRFVAAVRGTINGLVLVGLLEGLLLGIAYALAGLQHSTLLGLTTAVLATVPFGAPLVFVACALVLFARSQVTAAVALIAFGTVVTFVADHFIRPILIGNSTRLPFLWVLLGIFGGLETFGLIGLFLGPAIIALLIALWRDAARG